MKASKLALLSLAVTLAMILSFVESQIPAMVAIPGVKVGLANIAVVFILYKLGWKYAAVVSLTRVFLVGLLFGNGVSLLYSVAGAVVSFVSMVLLKRCKAFSYVAVSVCGGVMHNMGQIAMACIVMGTTALKYYIPFLLLSGTLAGIVIGLLAAVMVRRVALSAA
ncbi:MAG: Gx transporter family protein [Ruminococcaceae bacterium]|nr:Gx transporter family protein [Oscillospiraceae bacterium]